MTKQESQQTVVVVDDTPTNLRVLMDLLEEAGFKVLPFSRSTLALSAIEAQPPELILLDINMPEMNGIELCEQLKKQVTLRDIPVIFISALTDTADKVLAFEAGGVDYVTKPFQREEVLSRVGVHLALQHARRQLEEQNVHLTTTLTQLKAAQSQLVQSEKLAAVGMLAAGVAHEINNPLNYISSSASTVKRKVNQLLELLERCPASCVDSQVEQPSAPEWVEVSKGLPELTTNIQEGAGRAAKIVQGLRLFARVDRSVPEQADVQLLLESTLSLLTQRLGDCIRVERDYGEVGHLVCYPGKLNQVWMNLLVNALESLEQVGSGDGRIVVRTRIEEREGDVWISVTIVDNGPGIAEEAFSRLFEPFYTTKPIGKGIGLGLSISHSIVQEHGGSLVAENEPKGGARFTVRLPCQFKEFRPG